MNVAALNAASNFFSSDLQKILRFVERQKMAIIYLKHQKAEICAESAKRK